MADNIFLWGGEFCRPRQINLRTETMMAVYPPDLVIRSKTYFPNSGDFRNRYRVLIEVKKGFPNVCARGHGARVADPRRERLPSGISSQNRARTGSRTGPESIPNRARTGPAGSILIHPRSTPDPPQVQLQIKIRMQIQIQRTVTAVDSLLCYSGSFVG